MSIRSFLLFLVTPLVLAGKTEAKVSLPAVLPDTTAILFLVKDVSHLREHIGESPLAGLWGQMPRGEEAGRSQFIAHRIQTMAGLAPPAIFDHFEDAAALVIPDVRFLLAPEDSNVDWVVLAETANDAPWQKLAKDLAASNKALGTQKNTKTLHVFVSGKRDSSLAWSWSAGLGYLASSPSMLRRLMSARQSGAHLDQNENWRALEARAPEGDLTFYARLSDVDRLFQDRLSKGEADSLGEMVGITPSSVVSALGLGAFRAARMTATLEADQAQVDGGIVVHDEPGLSRLLAYQPGPVDRPMIIPPDAAFASVSRFRLIDFWNGLIEMMDRVGPGFSYFARGQMQKVAETAGLDFEKDILGNFGDETFLAYLPRHDDRPDSLAGMFDQLSGIRVKNPAKVLKAVAALVDWAPTGTATETNEARTKTKETKVIQGVKVTSVRFGSSENGSTLSYAVLDSMLLVAMGEDDILARALESRARKVSLWTRADVAPLLESIPNEAASVSYWDPSSLRRKIQTGRMDDERRAVAMMLLEQLGPSVAYTLKTPEGYVTRARIRRAIP